jgi:hypothetical protein
MNPPGGRVVIERTFLRPRVMVAAVGLAFAR